MSIASLPWYDLDEIRPATDAFWSCLAKHLRAEGFEGVPLALDRSAAYQAQWRSGRLLFSQSCGYDVRISYAGHLEIVATPCYGVEGAGDCMYSSLVVVREDSPYEKLEHLRGTRCLINTATSHSGMNILRSMIAPLHESGRFFSTVRVSGAHRRSLAQISRGEADVAAIDCITHALVERHTPSILKGTRVLCRTETVPAPPFVTRASIAPYELVKIREALKAAIADPAIAWARSEMLLNGYDVLPQDAYDAILEHERLADEYGYFEIHSRLGYE